MLQVGDKYIYFTKYGGVNKGEVKSIFTITEISTTHKVYYYHDRMTNTEGCQYMLNGEDGRFYKIISEMSDAEYDKIKDFEQKLMKKISK